jgi:hypothetical protein
MLLQEGGALEAVLTVLYQLSEVNHETPGEGAMHVQALKQDLTNLLLDERHALSSLFEEEQEDLAELVSVAVGITELVHDAVEEALSRKVVQFTGKLLDEFEVIFADKRLYLVARVDGRYGVFTVDISKLRVVQGLHHYVKDGSVDHSGVRNLGRSNSLSTSGQFVADRGYQGRLLVLEVSFQVISDASLVSRKDLKEVAIEVG